jgi:hypothetical protein
MFKGIAALAGAGKIKRWARVTFWLAFISAATRHDLLLGMVLYVIAAGTVLLIALSPLLVPGGLMLAWYWYRHRRLPGWLSRRVPRAVRRAVAGAKRSRLMDVFPGHRRPVHRRWPRHPQTGETTTDEFPVLAAPVRRPASPGEPDGVAFDRALARLRQRRKQPPGA